MFLPARRMLQYTPGNATDKNVCQVRLDLACLVREVGQSVGVHWVLRQMRRERTRQQWVSETANVCHDKPSRVIVPQRCSRFVQSGVWQRNRTGLDRVGGRSRGGGGGGFKERSRCRRRKCRWGGSTGSDFDHVHRNTLGTLASGTTLTPTTSTWELTRWV